MIFYNGFNLLVDLIIGFVVYKLAFSAGYSNGYRDGEEDNAPPFQGSCLSEHLFETSAESGVSL